MSVIYSIPGSLSRIVLKGFLGLVLSAGLVAASETDHPLEPAATSSPGATIESFISFLHEAYELTSEEGRSSETQVERGDLARKALNCLDLSEIAPAVRASVGKESGVLLKEVLDRIELPEATPHERWALILRHCRMALEWGRYGDERHTLQSMRSRLMAYSRGLRNGRALRTRFSTVESVPELEDIAAEYLTWFDANQMVIA